MEHSVVASPLSRKDIRNSAYQLRKMFNFDKTLYFPIVEFLELALPNIFKDFALVIMEPKDMGDCHGLALPNKNVIFVREDVYERAIHNEGRDRATLAHELGHFLLHAPGRVGYARIEKGSRIAAFRDPEWQANAFAGELLVPAHLVHGMAVHEVASECKVSMQAAQMQLSKLAIN